MAEQRRHARYRVAVAGEVTAEGETLTASTQDLSISGVGLVVDHPLMKGRVVSVTLFLTQDGIEDPDEKSFESKGKVMWLRRRDDGTFSVGVEFVTPAPAQQRLLEKFLSAIN